MNPKNNLTEESFFLLQEQKNEWHTLGDNYKALSFIKKKEIHFKEFSFIIQYNLNRLASTSARTDIDSIQNRKCFLCEENRPAEQRSIRVFSKDTNGKEYFILANPFPIFPEHFTIAAKEHIPQRIKGSFSTLLYFSKVLSEGLTLFYNGPECGASAPDHLHFQAGTKGYMPLEKEIEGLSQYYGQKLYSFKGIEVNAIDDGLRRMIHIKGNDQQRLNNIFEIFYEICSQYPYESEPKMNVIARFINEWNIMIMLREKHRPAQFFNKDDQLLFSPAGADYGGLSITPVEKDFNRLDETLLRDVFSQVTIKRDIFDEIVTKLSYSLSHS